MSTAALVFPNQLFNRHPALTGEISIVYLIEDDLFFGDHHYPVAFHRQKIQLHLASMAYYRDYLEKRGFPVHYQNYSPQHPALPKVFESAQHFGISSIDTVEPDDFILRKRLTRLAQEYEMKLEFLPSPGFINNKEENKQYRQNKKRWFMADFYQWQRRRLNILMDDGHPLGGQWSFDGDNRKKIPRQQLATIPTLSFAGQTTYHNAANQRIGEEFEHCPGDAATTIYPVTHAQAQSWLEDFLQLRFHQFGPYEDAIVAEHTWLYHSVLTPALNTGLLTPQQVIKQALDFAQSHQVPLASLEGFVRQIIGWREFMRATYDDLGVTMRTSNRWQHRRKIPASFYQGDTGIVPVDDAIHKVLRTGYCHHIERLMVLGGFFFLCEFDPNDIYHWFMSLFIDSYDWVMVPNVYAMSQHADGGLITTKPYFSGSNYIFKMSHYRKPGFKSEESSGHPHWSAIWDALYWRWIFKHQQALARNPRWAMMCRQADKMADAKRQQHQELAESYLSTLD